MQNQIMQDLPLDRRKQVLIDSADFTEEVGYMKAFDENELLVLKDTLADVDIEIDQIEAEKKDAMEGYTATLKPLKIKRKEILGNYKNKAEFVTERCFAFKDFQTKRISYYNELGHLVNSRAMRPSEMQKGIFDVTRGDLTGTDD